MVGTTASLKGGAICSWQLGLGLTDSCREQQQPKRALAQAEPSRLNLFVQTRPLLGPVSECEGTKVTGEKNSFKAQDDFTQVLQPTWAAEPGRVPARLCGRAGGRSTPASPGHGRSSEEPQQAPERAAARLVWHTRSPSLPERHCHRAPGCRALEETRPRYRDRGTEPGRPALSPAGEALTRSLFTEPVTSSSFRCRLNLGGMAGPCRGAPRPGREAWRREQGAPGRPRTGPAAPALTGPGRAGPAGNGRCRRAPVTSSARRSARPAERRAIDGGARGRGHESGVGGGSQGRGGAILGRGGASLGRGGATQGRGEASQGAGRGCP